MESRNKEFTKVMSNRDVEKIIKDVNLETNKKDEDSIAPIDIINRRRFVESEGYYVHKVGGGKNIHNLATTIQRAAKAIAAKKGYEQGFTIEYNPHHSVILIAKEEYKCFREFFPESTFIGDYSDIVENKTSRKFADFNDNALVTLLNGVPVDDLRFVPTKHQKKIRFNLRPFYDLGQSPFGHYYIHFVETGNSAESICTHHMNHRRNILKSIDCTLYYNELKNVILITADHYQELKKKIDFRNDVEKIVRSSQLSNVSNSAVYDSSENKDDGKEEIISDEEQKTKRRKIDKSFIKDLGNSSIDEEFCQDHVYIEAQESTPEVELELDDEFEPLTMAVTNPSEIAPIGFDSMPLPDLFGFDLPEQGNPEEDTKETCIPFSFTNDTHLSLHARPSDESFNRTNSKKDGATKRPTRRRTK